MSNEELYNRIDEEDDMSDQEKRETYSSENEAENDRNNGKMNNVIGKTPGNWRNYGQYNS